METFSIAPGVRMRRWCNGTHSAIIDVPDKIRKSAPQTYKASFDESCRAAGAKVSHRYVGIGTEQSGADELIRHDVRFGDR